MTDIDFYDGDTAPEEDRVMRTRGGTDARRQKTSRRRPDGVEKSTVIGVGLILFLAGVLSGLLGGKLVSRLKGADEEQSAGEISAEQERLDSIRTNLSGGGTVLESLRAGYPDYLVYYYDNEYRFSPLNNDLKKHGFDPDKLRVSTDGTYGYVDGDKEVIKGIDVSSHQGEIDWEKVAATNVDFAMIRVLYRGYETGKLVEDQQFKRNIEEAARTGVGTGVYIFTQSVSRDEVDEEINMLIGLLSAYETDYPVVVDVEDIPDADGRMDALTKAERTDIIKYYCERIEGAGYTPMIYFNIHGALDMVELSELEDYDKWFAAYGTDFYYPYAYRMWQYKDTGKVDGIDGNVDLDLYFP